MYAKRAVIQILFVRPYVCLSHALASPTMGHTLGHMPPSTSNCPLFIFSGQFRSWLIDLLTMLQIELHKLWHNYGLSRGCLLRM